MTNEIPDMRLTVDGCEVANPKFELSFDGFEIQMDWGTIAQHCRDAHRVECWIDVNKAVPSQFTYGVSPTTGRSRIKKDCRLPIAFAIPN